MCGYHPLHAAYHYADDHRRADALAYTPAPVATTPCPHCQYPVQEEFVFCPRCGAEVLTACPACHRAERVGKPQAHKARLL